MFERVSQNLCSPRSDRRIAILQRPSPRVDLKPILHSGKDTGLEEDFVKHREAILDDGSAKTEGIHKTGGQHGGVAGVAEAEDSLQSGEQFQTEGAGGDVIVDQPCFVLINGPNKNVDRMGDPVKQFRKNLYK